MVFADIEEEASKGERIAFFQNTTDPRLDIFTTIDLLIEPSLQCHKRAMDR